MRLAARHGVGASKQERQGRQASHERSTASKAGTQHSKQAMQASRAPSTASKHGRHPAQQASHAAQRAERGAAPRGGDGEGRREQDGGSSCGACRRPQPRRSESDQLRATQGSAGRLLLPPRATVPRRRPDELRAAGKIAGRRTCQPAVVRAARCARQPERAGAGAGGRGRPRRGRLRGAAGPLGLLPPGLHFWAAARSLSGGRSVSRPLAARAHQPSPSSS